MKEEEVKKREIIEKIKYLAREVSQQLSHEEILELRDVLREIDQLDKSEADGQLDKLANFIMSEVEGEPSQNQGVVDAAIRIIKSYQNREVLSLEWVDEHAVYPSFDEWPTEDYVHVGDLQNLIVPKQELPVIPKHVADWLDDNIEKHRTIYSFIISLVEVVDVFADPVPEKVWTYASENLDTMARAYLDGYTVAEEQKYLVSSRESIGFWFLAKNSLNEVSIGTNKDYYDTEWESLKLTEEEIKDYDPRYWASSVS